jgi:hypothetical protein
MKKARNLLSFLLVFMLVFSVAGQSLAAKKMDVNVSGDGRVQITLEFDDAKEAEWAMEYIGKMQSKNIFTGYEDGTFRPNQPVNRVEAIVTAVRLMGLEDEAKAKSVDAKLHFKDAKMIDMRYKWAKGYIIVALENGLFDSSEDQIQPDKPASRVWVASLLVRALGLEEEALSKMTTPPEFKDASAIPAGAVGYVNVAVEHGIVGGYPDNTFKPHKNVTRAEMATLLDRTNDGLLEESGAIKVMGTITAISFDSVTNEVYSGDSVTEDVYKLPNGTITVESFNGDSLTYGISSGLLMQYHTRFITADQLLVDDVVSLVVKDQVVIEAALLDQDEANENTSGIVELEVKVEFGGKDEYKLEYKNDDGKIKAEIKHETDSSEQKLEGEEAVTAVETFIEQLALTPDMGKEEIVEKVLSALQAAEDGFQELEIEIKFSNGTKIEIKIENEDFVEEESEENEADAGVREFKLEIELSGDEKYEYKYKNEDGKVEAAVEKKTSEGKLELKGDEAARVIEALFAQLALSEETSGNDTLEAVLSALEVDKDEVEKLELKIKFSNGGETKIELESEED